MRRPGPASESRKIAARHATSGRARQPSNEVATRRDGANEVVEQSILTNERPRPHTIVTNGQISKAESNERMPNDAQKDGWRASATPCNSIREERNCDVQHETASPGAPHTHTHLLRRAAESGGKKASGVKLTHNHRATRPERTPGRHARVATQPA